MLVALRFVPPAVNAKVPKVTALVPTTLAPLKVAVPGVKAKAVLLRPVTVSVTPALSVVPLLLIVLVLS